MTVFGYTLDTVTTIVVAVFVAGLLVAGLVIAIVGGESEERGPRETKERRR